MVGPGVPARRFAASGMTRCSIGGRPWTGPLDLDRLRPIAKVFGREVASRTGNVVQDDPMRLPSAIKISLRLVHVFVFGWVVFSVVEAFRTQGWRAGLTGVLIGAVIGALLLAAAWWFDRLPEPEPQDWSKE